MATAHTHNYSIYSTKRGRERLGRAVNPVALGTDKGFEHTHTEERERRSLLLFDC